MLNFDFTARLPATLPGIDRNLVVKFNNSWLLVGQEGRVAKYLVVYRAMVHKIRFGDGWVDPGYPPKFPGQEGTPGAAGWGPPVGNAILEGQVPDGRGGRYFDGIGVALITLDLADLDNLGDALTVLGDVLLLNSDGYEDPRIFCAYGRYFIHSHRYQPDTRRNAPGPNHRVYRGYSPQRLPFIPGDFGTENSSLFVKITELELRDDGHGNYKPCLGAEFFYGSNVSTPFEKNYGFFMDQDTLCAVYGVAPNDRPFTMLRAVRGIGGRAMNQFPRDNRFLVEEFQPNTDPDPDPARDNPRDTFLHIQKYYQALIPGRKCVDFSSSGPLLWNDGRSRWQGVGHVKLLHPRLYGYAMQLAEAALAAFPDLKKENLPSSQRAALEALNDDDFVNTLKSVPAGQPRHCPEQSRGLSRNTHRRGQGRGLQQIFRSDPFISHPWQSDGSGPKSLFS